MEKRDIKLDSIRIDGGTQIRVKIDVSVVDEYAESICDLPPADVFLDGEDIWLAGGFHRFHAHLKAGAKTMLCSVHKGTKRDALLFAICDNQGHGLRRTNLDKESAVEALLADAEWAAWSDSEIGRKTGVNQQLVGRIRKSSLTILVSEKPQSHSKNEESTQKQSIPATPSTVRKYTTRHGTTATMKIEKIGRSKRPKAAPSNDDPDVFFPSPEPKPLPPPKVEDQLGRVITDSTVAKIFIRRAEITGLMHQISQIKTTVLKSLANKDHLFRHVQESSWKADLTNAHRHLNGTLPHAICPACNSDGGLNKNCRVCKGSGWVTEDEYKNVPAEARA